MRVTVYTVPDLMQLTMALFTYPDAMVGVAVPGKRAPKHAAMQPICAKCAMTDPNAHTRLKTWIQTDGAQYYLFPTFDDMANVSHDVAAKNCICCGGKKK